MDPGFFFWGGEGGSNNYFISWARLSGGALVGSPVAPAALLPSRLCSMKLSILLIVMWPQNNLIY